jgi:ABC-type glycerol-3-phosphate transport system substrate-binding protein
VFAQGNAATYVTYNWMVPKLNDSKESSVAGKVELSQMPGGVSLNAGWGWAIPANAPNKEASWKFLQWVESFDVAKARALAGGSPTRSDVMSDPEVIAKYPHTVMVQQIMESSKIIPVIADAPQLIEVLGRELSEAVAGTKSSQQALDAVAEEMKSME